jgi:hypothetical protein
MHARCAGSAVLMLFLLGCPTRGGSSGSLGSSAAGRGAPDASAGSCVQNQACVRGAHWDREHCACVADGSSNDAADAGSDVCVQAQACVRGSQWSVEHCRCEPDANSEPDAGDSVCVQTQACVRGMQWSPIDCRCEPEASSDSDAGTATCVDNQLCIRGSHWDPTRCRCVTGDAGQRGGGNGPGGPNACNTSSDCRGPLPQLCMRCEGSGRRDSTACAHWTCQRSRCEVAFCD